MRKSNYIVLLLGTLSTMITAALTANVAGFSLPPAGIFGLIVLAAPLPWVLAVLPQLGVPVPVLPSMPVERPTQPAAATPATAEEVPLRPAP